MPFITTLFTAAVFGGLGALTESNFDNGGSRSYSGVAYRWYYAGVGSTNIDVSSADIVNGLVDTNRDRD